LLAAEEQMPGVDFDLAFVSRDVTGLSPKTAPLPPTQHFHDLMRAARGLRWVHIHASGTDRAIYGELRARGVDIRTSSGAHAAVVAQTALAGLLALARCFPQLMAAQRERRWAPLLAQRLPRDLGGQTALILGWGPVGQLMARMLLAVGLRCQVVRRERHVTDIPGVAFIGYDDLHTGLADADWLILACPLTPQTQGLINARALKSLPAQAHLVNVARGEIVVEPDLIEALRSGHLAGAYLDVFAHEPLSVDSPLWSMPQVIITPHAAGHSDGNEKRVAAMFLDNLRRWCEGGG
jgi:phosphoglycerate dehydrogenase-like enzyme